MLEVVVIGIDLAADERNPSGWALWKGKHVQTCHLYQNGEIIEHTVKWHPTLIAIDAPLNLPKNGAMRVADREMHKRGYAVFPPVFKAMRKLTIRAIYLAEELQRQGFDVIEVHPLSTRKALSMPTKEWGKIQAIFTHIGLEGDLKTRMLSSHEIDAVTAALTGYLYLAGWTECVGDEEGHIVVPKKVEWRKLKL
jgi:predicted nuclease with RNAse H fold